ncbi:MAG: OsmC family protein [Flavobacteriales bacterium]|nr:MAG: OsmC family protein [Flavobacteriales bacterium]
MDTAKVKYLGDLRCEAVHVRSGQRIVTDAPPDNQGRGEAFSPSDLTSTSLACCMLTIMGIAARDRGWDLSGMEARVVKHMASDPRRIAKVEVHFSLDGSQLDAKARTILERAAHTCPVALSLREDLVQEIVFDWQGRP